MRLNTYVRDGVTIVEVPGDRLDASNAKDFKKEMDSVLESTTQIALDLSEIKFMDSSGLGAVLSSLRVVAGKGGDLKLYGMRYTVRALYELVRMHRIFEIVNTQDEAVHAFAK